MTFQTFLKERKSNLNPSIFREKNGSQHYKYQKFIREVIRKISTFLCPKNPHECHNFITEIYKTDKTDSLLKQSVESIIAKGSRQNRILSQAILAKSFNHLECHDIIIKFTDLETRILPRHLIGHDKWRRLRQIYKNLAMGEDITTNSYKNRIDLDIMKDSIDFIFGNCHPIP